MRDNVTFREKCIELPNHVVNDPDKPAATVQGGGFSETFQIAANMLRIDAEKTYHSLETLLERTPVTRLCTFKLERGVGGSDGRCFQLRISCPAPIHWTSSIPSHITRLITPKRT
jgi:hypothetical protein